MVRFEICIWGVAFKLRASFLRFSILVLFVKSLKSLFEVRL